MKPRYYPYKTTKPATTTTKKQNPFLKGKGKEPIKKKQLEPEKNNILTEDFRSLIRENAYIGTNGYTIPKSVFDSDVGSGSEHKELIFLRESLTLEPKKDGYCPTTALAPVSFPVFRENASKIYLPQFYGIERYGMPKNKLSFGDDISVPFVKPIRDYQEAIIDVYLRHITHSKEERERTGGGILEVPCGRGKCLGINTPILMFDGSIKKVQDVVVGDFLMGDDSTPRKVLTLARGREPMYKIECKKGDGYIVNESHILSLKYGTYMNKDTPKNSVLDISVLDYLKLPKYYHGRSGPLYGYRVPITFPDKEVEIDPYLFGYWLGDGSSKGTGISTQESTIIKYIVDCFKTKHTTLYLKYTGFQYDYRINSIDPNTSNKSNIFMNFLRDYNIINNKHIPTHYKCNSSVKQLELLAGIIDSDGHYHDNCYEITQKSEKLLDDIIYLAKSLGFSANKRMVKKSCQNGFVGTYYTVNICGEGLEKIPVKCPRKKGNKRELLRDCLKYRISVKPIGIDDYYGFEIDGNRRFVLGDYTVTHNTVMGLKIISILSKKTLILVHKEFLMNQWIERIAEFLPAARVGKIQGPVFDIVEKDIVIGMIQSLYDRTFPTDAFSSFGLTIIDEVHRIGSEEFSKTLFKTITRCMLGISATVERKDGLTCLLYHFIGPKIYSEERKDDTVVEVRAIEYIHPQEEYNVVAYDYKGNVQYSTMVSKISNFVPRSQFLVQVLRDLIRAQPDQQIMVLSHIRALLTFLYDSLNSLEEPSNKIDVGYYVGGMKKEALEATEKKQVVLATYAMAAEALDIKTLNTLVMVSPKTDIIQSVGRILRMKADGKVIVDIVDTHDVFQNQWKKRRAYYKKCGYGIRYVKSTNYVDMSSTHVESWKRVNIPTVTPEDSTLESKEEEEIEKRVCHIPIAEYDFSDPDLEEDENPDEEC